ncbi:immunoglobulin superfamily member 10 [Oryzias latipes]|uniref:Ig-like domain-containing protein n=1 Tax=Oryzias latipes TaxID=8090 RepID=A0A3B3IEP2_ORYLA|nr:immunoglobulin superfamily member 10 [Oryzias latipes]
MWTVFMLIFLASPTGSSGSSCEVVITPHLSVVRFGDSFTATCNALGTEIQGMGWESPDFNTPFKEGVSSLRLQIDKVQVWKIDPICYATPFEGDQCTKIPNITVYQSPKMVSISQSLDDIGVMREGQLYSIECEIRNVAPTSRLSVIWYIEYVSVYEERFKGSSHLPATVSSFLNMTANRSHDRSDIWCEAKLDFRPEGESPILRPSVLHRLAVLYAPVCSEPANETLKIPPSGNVTLNCSAIGNPKPSYDWCYPQNLQSTAINGDNSIRTLTFALQGVYTCNVSNSQGNTIKYFILEEAERDRTTFGILLGVFLSLGALIILGGALFLTRRGTFSFIKCPQGSPSII